MTSRNRRNVLKGLGLASTALLAGCSGAPAENGSGSGTNAPSAETGDFPLSLAASGQFDTMDPHLDTGGPDLDPINAVYESLVYRNPYTNEYHPGVATEWEYVNEKQTQMKFQIRENATFHSGATLTPEDIVFTLERSFTGPDEGMGRINSPNQSDIPFESAEVVDGEHAVLITLSEVYPYLAEYLAENGEVMEKKWTLDQPPDELSRKMNGTGWFSFNNWKEGVELNISRYEDYWGDPPSVTEATFTPTTEASTRANQLLAGEVDIIKNVALPDVSRVNSDENARVEPVATDRSMWFAMRTVGDDNPPTASKKFRLAMNYAIDTQSLVENILSGRGKPLSQPVPESWNGHLDADWSPYGYPQDLQRAEQLVEESGHAGVSLQIMTPQGHYLKDTELTQAAASMVDQLPNVNCSANIVPPQDWSENINAGRENLEEIPPMYLLGIGGGPPDGTVKIRYSFTEQRLGNLSSYTNPDLEDAYARAMTLTDTEKRAKVIREMVQILHDDAAAVFTHRQAGLYGVSNRVDWKPAPNEQLYPGLAKPSN